MLKNSNDKAAGNESKLEFQSRGGGVGIIFRKMTENKRNSHGNWIRVREVCINDTICHLKNDRGEWSLKGRCKKGRNGGTYLPYH